MKKRAHKKRRGSAAQQAARSPRTHKAPGGLPRMGLQGRPATEFRASQARVEQRSLPAACCGERAPSLAEPTRSEMAARTAGGEAPAAPPAACPDTTGANPDEISASPNTIGASAHAPTGSGPYEESGTAAATVSVAIAAQLLGVSRRTIHYLLLDGRLKGWRLRPRGWWRITRDSLARLSGGVSSEQADTLQI